MEKDHTMSSCMRPVLINQQPVTKLLGKVSNIAPFLDHLLDMFLELNGDGHGMAMEYWFSFCL